MQTFWDLFSQATFYGFSFLQPLGVLAVTVVLLILAGRAGLWRRSNRFHNLFVKLYYLYIPCVVFALAVPWFLTDALHNGFTRACEQARASIIAESVEQAESVRATLLEGQPTGTKISIKSFVQTAAKEYLEKAMPLEGSAMNLSWGPISLNSLVDACRSGLATGIVAVLEERMIKSLADKTTLPVEAITVIWDKDIMTELHEGLFVDTFQHIFNRILGTVYSYLRTLALFLLLPPLLETALSKYLMHRKRKKGIPASA